MTQYRKTKNSTTYHTETV